VRAEFVLDEGLLITGGIIAGLRAPAALIGVAEKGYLSATLSVTAERGTPRCRRRIIPGPSPS
jgi:carboxypeptidase PM20D1